MLTLNPKPETLNPKPNPNGVTGFDFVVGSSANCKKVGGGGACVLVCMCGCAFVCACVCVCVCVGVRLCVYVYVFVHVFVHVFVFVSIRLNFFPQERIRLQGQKVNNCVIMSLCNCVIV